MSAVNTKNTTKNYYLRIALVMLVVSICAAALEYRSYLREESLRQEVIRTTVRQTLDAIGPAAEKDNQGR